MLKLPRSKIVLKSPRSEPGPRKPTDAPLPCGEWEALAILRRALHPGASLSGIELGIGDDCAVLKSRGSYWVWTQDACEEEVHFRTSWASPSDIAHKAFHAAISDVAAMGAKPVAALCHLSLGPGQDSGFLKEFAAAQARVARRAACPIIGGNLSRGQRFLVVTTVLGEAKRRSQLLLRSGAKPGDEVWLLGQLGLARRGFELLEAQVDLKSLARQTQLAFRACLRAQLRPVALLDSEQLLRHRVRSCLDVSDGLAGDGAHLAESSRVRLVLEESGLRACASPALRRALLAPEGGLPRISEAGHQLGLQPGDPLDYLLHGGEDYALLATGTANRRPPGVRVLGKVERGEGVFLRRLEGRLDPLGAGFSH